MERDRSVGTVLSLYMLSCRLQTRQRRMTWILSLPAYPPYPHPTHPLTLVSSRTHTHTHPHTHAHLLHPVQLTVSHYEVYLDGPLKGTPVETSFSDSLTAHRASDPKSDSEGDVGWRNVAVGAVNGSLFAPALVAHC